MTFSYASKKAKKVRKLYDKLNKKNKSNEWGYRELTEGLVGDVGDLMKLVMAKGRFRNSKVKDLDEELKHELCDCLWSVLVIADELGFDLNKEFQKKMDELEKRILTSST